MRSYPLSILTEEYYWMWPSVNVKHEPSIIVNALSSCETKKPKAFETPFRGSRTMISNFQLFLNLGRNLCNRQLPPNKAMLSDSLNLRYAAVYPAANSWCYAFQECDPMPPKIRELIADLEAAGFQNRGGKGSHRNFVHPNVAATITISGKLGNDAKHYQVHAVKRAVEDSKK